LPSDVGQKGIPVLYAIAKKLMHTKKSSTFPQRHRVCASAKSRTIDFKLMIRMWRAKAKISIYWFYYLAQTSVILKAREMKKPTEDYWSLLSDTGNKMSLFYPSVLSCM